MCIRDRYDDFFGDGVDRRHFRSKSDAATRREEDAKANFRKVKEEAKGVATKTTYELLDPKQHLTGACYTSFRKFVMSHAGWTVRRTETTAEDRARYKITRVGKTFFVSVVYDPKKDPSWAPAPPAARTDAKENAAAKENVDVPPTKKQKKSEK